MAESIAFNLAEKLILKLGSLALEAWNVKSDLKKLKKTMLTIGAVILDAEEKQETNHLIKLWLENLKDALEDVEDLLDDIAYEALKREVTNKDKKAKKVRLFFSSSNPLVFSFKTVRRIKEIREKLKSINDERSAFELIQRTPEPLVFGKTRKETHSYIREEAVVGREEQKRELLKFLLNTDMDDYVSIVSIIGMGGLGKTALAQFVFNDKEVKDHFEPKKWVCVSDDFDVKSIATKIVGSNTNDQMDQVQHDLRNTLEGRRYLLVLDDTWNEDRNLWLELMMLLKKGAKGSKIIITTRSKKVSETSDTSLPFILEGLDEEKSWRLFTQLAFKNGREPENQSMIEIGKEIVKKCAGVPLAIRSIGNLMHSKKTEKEWSRFKDNDLVKIDEQGDKIFQLIKLSYDHLPFHLKKCFAYCSLFPKDYEIERSMLIRLWVAQGFVQSSNDSICLEDIANEYFMSLAHRSFFQDFYRDEVDGNIIWCKMHDLMQELAKFVAENNCVTINKEGEQGVQIDERTRHLSINLTSVSYGSSWEVPRCVLKASKIRTFLPLVSIFDASVSLEESECNSILSRFEKLRVLNLRSFQLRTLPTCIGMLKHLRYLVLSRNREIEVLPGSICKLYNLQTLSLIGCSRLRELPRDLWKLKSLRHLELEDCDNLSYMPCGIGQLTNLQTLSLFVFDTSSTHSARARELAQLSNLKGELEIKGLECLRHNTTEVKDMNLMAKTNVDGLRLTWNPRLGLAKSEAGTDNIILEGLRPHLNLKRLRITGFGGEVLSGWVYSLTKLLDVSLFDCKKLQNLPPLHLLPHLRGLSLYNLECLEWTDKDGSDDSPSTFFPSLQTFYLDSLPNFRGWWRCSGEGTEGGRRLEFSCLDQLWILNCPNLISMPLHPSVSNLQLWDVSRKILMQALNESSTAKLKFLWINEINDLTWLSGVLQNLTTLRHLSISDCKELDPCNDEDGAYSMQWSHLQNLHNLELVKIPEMESLPEGLQHLSTLRRLVIDDCDNLTNLPEWIATFGQSLQILSIRRCRELKSLPDGVRHLTSLQRLQIEDCRELKERCEREVGPDWPKISHIPDLEIH